MSYYLCSRDYLVDLNEIIMVRRYEKKILTFILKNKDWVNIHFDTKDECTTEFNRIKDEVCRRNLNE